MFIAIGAAVLNAIGQIVRGYESKNPISSNFVIGSVWLLVALAVIGVKLAKA